ncbi:MAG: lysine--tRNA ligase [bacterium]
MDINELRSKVSARKLWPFAEAKKALSRHNYSTDHVYTLETGFGPSGLPHIGTFGEVVRTEFIINALKEFGFKTKLIVFSDDLDGLRKVPEGMPDWLKEHLGKPVSSIPDPFGNTKSFSDYMNSKLIEMLNWMGIDYEFKNSRSSYESGEFDPAIKILMSNFKKLEDIIAPTLSEATLENWHPFFPICENCGKVLTTMVKDVDLEKHTVKYICDKEHGEVKGCGHEGEQSYLGGRGKMTWRVDWPLRWYSLGIDYELYGKDLIDSYEVGKKIMFNLFNTKPPENIFYEMFLDETGAKISKSKGKGLTVEGWLKYGTIESLHLLMYRNPRKAKELSFGIIPQYVDDTFSLSADYHKNPSVDEHDFRFITRFKPDDKKFPEISYMLICNLMTALKSADTSLIKNYLSKQKEFNVEEFENVLDDLLVKAENYYNDFIIIEKKEITFTDEQKNWIAQFVDLLKTELDAEKIHNSVYGLAESNNTQPKELFKVLYNALIGQDRGPRLGNFVKIIGQEKTIEILSKVS